MTIGMPSKRLGWVLFSIAILLAPASRALWMIMLGPSWWYAYHGDGMLGRSADRIIDECLILALVVGIAAPLVAPIKLSRKVLFSTLAAVSVFVAFYLSTFMVLFIYGL